MAKCKKCEEDILNLNYCSVIHHSGIFEKGADGEYSFEEDIQDFWNEAQSTFECPECGEELFYNSDDAEQFLNNNDKNMPLLIAKNGR